MFIDEAIITCTAGSGGDGCHSFDRSRPTHPRSNGGDGGNGGSVIIEARQNIQTLLDFQWNRHFTADGGGHGSSNNKTGRSAGDKEVGVPPGTEVFDHQTGEFLRDLDHVGQRVTVARGGAGGHGNDKRRHATQGEAGEEKEISLKLKLIADIGIVGFPNSGKSTLISRISSAKSKSAAYPFTTKNPVLGVVKFDNDKTMVFADIPGIIEGAHGGKGLGLEFLKHVERTRLLLHLIDFAAVDGRDPVSDYLCVNEELVSYSKKLAAKEQIVVANKMDIPAARDNYEKFSKKIKAPVFPISAATGEGIEALLRKLKEL